MKRSLLSLLIVLTPALSWAQEGHQGGCYCGNSGVPVVSIEADFDPSGPFATAARSQLELWNRYIDVFDHRTGTDGAAGQNSKAEIVGFDIDTVEQVYGIEIDESVFGFAFLSPQSSFGSFDACPRPSWVTCGTFGETDVIVNADFIRGFSAQGPPDFDDDNGPAYFQATVAHEVGHTLGFHHNFENLSVMNYYEDFAAQYIGLSDVMVARAAYPSRVRAVTDMAIYPFWYDPTESAYDAAIPIALTNTRLPAGGDIGISNFTVENLGTSELTGVRVRFYLTRDNVLGNSGDVLVGGFEYARFPTNAYDELGPDGGYLTIPDGTAAGEWKFGAIVSINNQGDAITYNNQWIAPQTITIINPAGGRLRRGVRRP